MSYWAAAAAIIGAGAQYKSAEAAEDAASAQRQAQQIQRQAQLVQEARQRRALIRELRVKQAENQAVGYATGMQGSSALAGAQGSLNSSFIDALSYLDTQSALASKQSSFLDTAQLHQAKSNLFSAGASLAYTGAKTIFNLENAK